MNKWGSGLSFQSHISLVDPSSFWLPDCRLLSDGQFRALQPLYSAGCVVFPSFSFAPEKTKWTSHVISFSPTILTKCIPLLCGVGCPGNCEHHAVERRFQDSKQAPCPTPNPPMLFTSESSWASRNHNDLIGFTWAFNESLVPYPGTTTNWEEKKGRKTRERKKNPHNSLFTTSFPKILEPQEEKWVGTRTVGKINNIK